MERSEHLMLTGVTAVCPDCGDERVLLLVEASEYCCTSCDAAVFLVEPLSSSAALLSLAG